MRLRKLFKVGSLAGTSIMAVATLALSLAFATGASAQEVGTSYTPAGSGFTITASDGSTQLDDANYTLAGTILTIKGSTSVTVSMDASAGGAATNSIQVAMGSDGYTTDSITFKGVSISTTNNAAISVSDGTASSGVLLPRVRG